jgi:hypothetical protein
VCLLAHHHHHHVSQGGNMVMDLNTMEEYPLEVGLEEGNDVTGAQARDFSECRAHGGGGRRRGGCRWCHSLSANSSRPSPNPHPYFASTTHPHALVLVSPTADGHVTAIAAGANHSLAVTRSGRVYQFGGRAFLSPSPVDTGYIRAGKGAKEVSVRFKAVGVSAGEGVSALVDEAGHLFTWGKNLNTGMLGHREYAAGTNQPVRVEALVGAGPVAHLSLGSKHATAVIGAAASSHAPLR